MNSGGPQNTPGRRFVKKQEEHWPLEELRQQVLAGDRAALSRSVTLIESNAQRHAPLARELLQSIMPDTGDSIRIGISGVPGAGKSTFIESFGLMLCERGHRIAVLAVDPSSSVNGGSILGDKTRMERLSRHPGAFIRPSPSGGTLGGVHRKTRETILLCEAAGFDVILVETVGVGQSEAMVRGMVDYFLLLALTGAGDELQGMKKGILELVDAVAVNKADGPNFEAAYRTAADYKRILHFLQPATKGQSARAHACSALTGEGLEELWGMIAGFVRETKETGVFADRRRVQTTEWLHTMIQEQLMARFYQNEAIRSKLPVWENEVIAGSKTADSAAEEALRTFYGRQNT